MTQGIRKSMLIDPTEKTGIMYSNGEYSDVVTPLIVDLNDIFDDRLTIVIEKFVKKQTKLAVNIGTTAKMHSMTGTVVSIKECAQGYEAVLEVDFIPDGLIKDLEELLSVGNMIVEDNWE